MSKEIPNIPPPPPPPRYIRDSIPKPKTGK